MDNLDYKAHPWIACAFMLCIGVISTTLALWSLSMIGLNELLPYKESLTLSAILGLLIGSTKHSTILNASLTGKRAFFAGMKFFLVLLPFFDIAALFMVKNQFSGTDNFHASLSEYFALYLIILVYSFIFIGSWLSVINGFLFATFNHFLKLRLQRNLF